MSRRADQFASAIRRAVQEIISRGLHDPRVSGLITVTSVSIDESLRDATILISVLPEDRQELVLHGIQAAAGHIRHEIADHIKSRQTPTLRFKLDVSTKKEAGVLRALARVDEERRQHEASTTPPTPAPESHGDSAP